MATRHHTWEQFEHEFITPGVGATYSPPGSPVLSIYSDPHRGRVGIEIELMGSGDICPIPFRSLALELKFDNGRYSANFWISAPELFEQFYSLATHIADLVQLHGVSPQTAIEEAIEKIRALHAMESLLGEEKQVGLWGELWLLSRLIDHRGTTAVDNWKGASRAVHDFQFEDIELEVKTTRNERRRHMISSLTQLVPSPDFRLYVCSIQVEGSFDKGRSVPELVTEVERRLEGNAAALAKLSRMLRLVGFVESDARFYKTRYYLRNDPALIPADSDLPKFSPSLLEGEFGSGASVRFDTVSYRLDLTGFELPHDDPLSRKIFGKENPSA